MIQRSSTYYLRQKNAGNIGTMVCLGEGSVSVIHSHDSVRVEPVAVPSFKAW